jgi:topoisomerase-4 subunit A
MKEPNESQYTHPEESSNKEDENGHLVPLSGMYKEWFLDYASYVILERAVPALLDGLKPVQRRILHSMHEMEDGRYNKVANVIGNTMKYHPHGDASIGDAMVQLGQKDLLIDAQGNWGNVLTGDRAAAARYIEARLTPFALEVVFNKKTTNWLSSYDGRNLEPEFLPVKFPLLLAQGAEGIAVGMACKIMPHNFIELIDASIDVLKGKKISLLPDFHSGGMADFSQYNDGLRGGRIRVRAKIRQEDKKTLIVHEIPFGTTTSTLIESIIRANSKSKIKIRKIEDNTAEHVEIQIHLPPGISPDKTIDALYAFTDCEVSIAPNAAVIINDKPQFMGVSDILKFSTQQTVDLLQKELEIRKRELEEQWHFSSLERIFIEQRIYRDIEEEETWEGVLEAIKKGLKPFLTLLRRKVTEEDIVRLTEIKIKRISKFDAFKADEHIRKLEEELAQVEHHLGNLTIYAIDYFKRLKETFANGRERRTEIKVFDTIQAKKVIVANKKLYANMNEGFIGWMLKKDEFIADCSEIDDVIVFRKDGMMQVTQIADKKFVGKNLLHVGLWKKGDRRTIYHLVYRDGKRGAYYMKRFAVSSITRDREYAMTQGTPGSSIVYLSVHPNGERELVNVQLRARPS